VSFRPWGTAGTYLAPSLNHLEPNRRAEGKNEVALGFPIRSADGTYGAAYKI